MSSVNLKEATNSQTRFASNVKCFFALHMKEIALLIGIVRAVTGLEINIY